MPQQNDTSSNEQEATSLQGASGQAPGLQLPEPQQAPASPTHLSIAEVNGQHGLYPRDDLEMASPSHSAHSSFSHLPSDLHMEDEIPHLVAVTTKGEYEYERYRRGYTQYVQSTESVFGVAVAEDDESPPARYSSSNHTRSRRSGHPSTHHRFLQAGRASFIPRVYGTS